jgi:ribonuclease VapC
MFIDASVINAIIGQEEGWETLGAKIAQGGKVYVCPMVIWESVVGLAREAHISFDDAEGLVDRFVEETKAQIMTISPAIGREALAASRQFGKGRHRAALNPSDCFSYGCAKAYRLPLLFKGDHFPHTDISVA